MTKEFWHCIFADIKQNNETMARKIQETPILTGKDAERFIKRMQETRTVSDEEIERVKKNYEYIMSIAKF